MFYAVKGCVVQRRRCEKKASRHCVRRVAKRVSCVPRGPGVLKTKCIPAWRSRYYGLLPAIINNCPINIFTSSNTRLRCIALAEITLAERCGGSSMVITSFHITADKYVALIEIARAERSSVSSISLIFMFSDRYYVDPNMSLFHVEISRLAPFDLTPPRNFEVSFYRLPGNFLTVYLDRLKYVPVFVSVPNLNIFWFK